MNPMIDFKCTGESMELIPEAVLKATGVSLHEAHSEKKAMALVAARMKMEDGDSICRVPFCVTVEAEAFGGKVKIGDEKTGPRVDGFRYSNIEELAGLQEIDFSAGRIREVLDSVELLSQSGSVVSLNVEGPFTILTLLMSSLTVYKGIKTNPGLIGQALELIEENMVKYMRMGIEKGANIISYADPSGDINVVGPKIYRELSGKSSYNILKKMENHLGDSIIHLCGRTSTGFEKIGFCTGRPVDVPGGITYGEAILHLLKEKDIKFMGHQCFKSTPFRMKTPVVWKLELM